MHNTLPFPTLRSPEEVSPAFNVVIAYEDFETGKHAKKTYDYLVEHLGDECGFTNQMWKFGVLAIAKLREMAARDAMGADIILIAAHGTTELPGEVKAWVEQWLAEKTEAIALVGLFDADVPVDNAASAYLAEVARRAGIEYFSHPGVWPGREVSGFDSGERSRKTFSVLADLARPDESFLHWGINE